jgi:hypothetical protein
MFDLAGIFDFSNKLAAGAWMSLTASACFLAILRDCLTYGILVAPAQSTVVLSAPKAKIARTA